MDKVKAAEMLQADRLEQFTGTTQYYPAGMSFMNTNMTDGAHYVAEQAGAYWLMDAIASYQSRYWTKVAKKTVMNFTIVSNTFHKGKDGAWKAIPERHKITATGKVAAQISGKMRDGSLVLLDVYLHHDTVSGLEIYASEVRVLTGGV